MLLRECGIGDNRSFCYTACMTFQSITTNILVAPQIDATAVTAAAKMGVKLIINNRPDGESDDQTPAAAIEAAAHAEGMQYVAIPVTHAGFSRWQIDAMDAALAAAEGKVLAYCRSGTRSTLLWALAEAKQGGDPDAITNMAAKAGYDVSPIRPLMDMLKAQR
jgi:uncharacterized protein (TIGR01244 family)